MLMPPTHLLAEAAPVAVEGNQGPPEIADYLAKLAGLSGRDRRNAERVVVRHNDIRFKELPPLFDEI
jgi:hypothetical protein